MKEKEFTLHRCSWCMTRKCPLCGKKFDSTKPLNYHILEENGNYQFLCKFCKCRRSYSLRNSADRHVRHYSPPRFMCDTCGKQFHEKYVFEAHKNVGTYPKCDCVYKPAAKYQRHLKRHHEPQEPRTCS